MSDLAELLKRVEAAAGPDRELDLALATALVPDVVVMRQRDDDSGADPYTHWEYTGSIDAALALVARVMPNASGYVGFGKDAVRVDMCPDGVPSLVKGEMYENCTAPTSPLALVRILLSACIAREAG